MEFIVTGGGGHRLYRLNRFKGTLRKTSKKASERLFIVTGAALSSTPDEEPVPDALLCQICKDLMTDAVMTPCCSNSFCNEYEHVCHVSPDDLNINMFSRQEVNCFKNTAEGSGFSHPRKPLYSYTACSSTSPSLSHRSSSVVSEPQGSRTNSSSGKRRRGLRENGSEDNGSGPLPKKSKNASL